MTFFVRNDRFRLLGYARSGAIPGRDASHGLFAAVVAVLALVPPRLPDWAWLIPETFDLLHFPGGAALQWWLSNWLQRRSGPRSQATILCASAIAILALEGLQAVTGRTASVADVVSSLSGAGLVAAVQAGLQVSHVRTTLSVVGVSLVVLGTLVPAVPVAYRWAWAIQTMYAQNLLVDMEDGGSLLHWSADWGKAGDKPALERVTDPSEPTGHVLKLTTSSRSWGGARLRLPNRPRPPGGFQIDVMTDHQSAHVRVQCTIITKDAYKKVIESDVRVSEWSRGVQFCLPDNRSEPTEEVVASVLIYLMAADGEQSVYLDNLKTM